VRTLAEIRGGLVEAHDTVSDYFGGLPLDELFRRRPGEWAPMQDLRHLTRTRGTLARTLALPQLVLRTRFGEATAPSATYEALAARYHEGLRQGFKAPSRFVPPDADPDDAEVYRDERLRRWSLVSDDLLAALDAWDEAAVDRHVVPHPALGSLTVREILLFTHIHDLHHVEVARRRLAG
jgi:hypothetical protein